MNKMSGKFVGKFLKKELLDVETMDETAIINLRINNKKSRVISTRSNLNCFEEVLLL